MKSSTATYGFLSSAPPTACGIATFSAALGSALMRQGADVRIVRVLDVPEPRSASVFPVIGDLVAAKSSTIGPASEALNECDVVFIQHEYGLYGGPDGTAILPVLEGIHVPTLAILHTVLPFPTPHQVYVLNEVIRNVDSVVVMTSAAEATLRRVNDVGDALVTVIPHGAAIADRYAATPRRARKLLLTWGLIGPGKGIEWVIDALAKLKDIVPAPLYVIAGRTHPKVLAYEGDVYRRMLEQRVQDNDVSEMVVFDNSYRDLPSLNHLISSADVVLLPYDSVDQATSGVLVDAIAAGRPVIATTFPHAVELLSEGAGLVVEHKDPDAISRALRRTICEPKFAEDMQREAQRIAPSLGWDAVATQYLELTDRMLLSVGVG
jgi:glycosyltransferase involved in cell wall biosynthesis